MIEFKIANYDITEYRELTLQYPKMFPELFDDDSYWEIVRVLRADFIPIIRTDDNITINIVSIATLGDHVPVVAKIDIVNNRIERIILYIDNLRKYKLLEYIYDLVHTAVKPFSPKNTPVYLSLLHNLKPQLRKTDKNIVVISGDDNELKQTIESLRNEIIESKDYDAYNIPAFDNITELAYSRNSGDEILMKLIDIVDELLRYGEHGVYYNFGNTQEPIFVIEIPDRDTFDTGETGWIILTRYKNRAYNIFAYLVNSDRFIPLPKRVAEKVIEYYEGRLNYLARNKMGMLLSLLNSEGFTYKTKDELQKIIEYLESIILYDDQDTLIDMYGDNVDWKLIQKINNMSEFNKRTLKELLLPLSKREEKILNELAFKKKM